MLFAKLTLKRLESILFHKHGDYICHYERIPKQISDYLVVKFDTLTLIFCNTKHICALLLTRHKYVLYYEKSVISWL